jgi:hypothetical protein
MQNHKAHVYMETYFNLEYTKPLLFTAYSDDQHHIIRDMRI